MVVVLPDDNITTVEVSDALTPDAWHKWMEMLADNTPEVDRNYIIHGQGR